MTTTEPAAAQLTDTREALVRAAAHREAAAWLRAEYTGPGADVPIRRAADRLDVRADRIERGDA
jgi:hypothetical protein